LRYVEIRHKRGQLKNDRTDSMKFAPNAEKQRHNAEKQQHSEPPDNDPWYSTYEQGHGPHGSLDESLRYFMRVFEEAPSAYLVTDPRLVITNANAAAQRLFGRAVSRLKGKPMSLLIAESDRETFRRIIARAVLDSDGPVSRPLRLRIASGEAEVPFSASVLRNADNEAGCICWIFHDRHQAGGDDIL